MAGKQKIAATQYFPDILYSQSYDGEIVIEWNEDLRKLNLLTMVDMTTVFQGKQVPLNVQLYNQIE